MCADKPCFWEIIPGVTAWNEAVTILANSSKGTRVGNADNTVALENGYHVDLNGSPTQGVDTIGVQYRFYNANALTLGDFVEQYGTPCLVGVASDPALLTLIYPFMMVDVVREEKGQRLGLGSSIYYIQLLDPQLRYGTTADLCWFAKKIFFKGTAPWLGFRSWDYYRSYCTEDCLQ